MTMLNVKSETTLVDKDSWATPTEIVNGALAYFQSRGFIDPHKKYGLDVCASEKNKKARSFYSEDEDALEAEWHTRMFTDTEVAWCNPPYSRGMKEAFINKAHEQAEFGVETIMLLPNDTSAQWFSMCVNKASLIVFICNGRISFVHNETGEKVAGNNAGSILALFGKRNVQLARTLYVTKRALEELGNG